MVQLKGEEQYIKALCGKTIKKDLTQIVILNFQLLYGVIVAIDPYSGPKFSPYYIIIKRFKNTNH